MWLQIWKSCWSKDTWNQDQKWKIFTHHIKHFSCPQCNSKSANLLIWRYIKIRTNMTTYLAALNGTLNRRIWGPKDAWKSEPKWKTIHLLLIRLWICKSCWSKDTWKSAQKWKTIQLFLIKLKICESCWSKDKWKSRPKWKPFSRSYPQIMTFWSEKAWTKTQISLVKYA